MNKLSKSEFDLPLANSVLGNTFDAKELDMIFTHNEIISFEPEETILQQGKMTNGIYFIIHGNVMVTAKILGERITTIEILERSDFFGDISYIENIPCATSIIAKTHVECLFMNHLYFELISSYFPETKYKILSAIAKQACHRLRNIHNKITTAITESDMVRRTFFREFIQSLTKPEQIPFEEAGIQLSQLQHWPQFSAFNKSDIQELVKHLVTLKAPKYCSLISKSGQDNVCYIVIHGAVQSSVIQNNKIAKLSVIGPVTLFTGPGCIEADSPLTITFSTCEPAVLFMIDKSTLDLFKKDHPLLWYKLFDFICLSIIALEKSISKLDVRLQIEAYNR